MKFYLLEKIMDYEQEKKNQSLISASYKTAESKATLTLTKGRVYGTRTTHAAVDAGGIYLEDLSKSLVQYQGR